MLLGQGVRAQKRNLMVCWPNCRQAAEQCPLQNCHYCARVSSAAGAVCQLVRILFPEFRKRNAIIEDF
jgi:hypothetical protein